MWDHISLQALGEKDIGSKFPRRQQRFNNEIIHFEAFSGKWHAAIIWACMVDVREFFCIFQNDVQYGRWYLSRKIATYVFPSID